MKRAIPVLSLLFLLLLPLAAAQPSRGMLPLPETIRLSNGLTLFYVRVPDLPLVSFRMVLPGAGSAAEPMENEGVSSIMAELLTKGTSKMKAEDVAEALDSLGADLKIYTTPEYMAVDADSLASQFPRLLELTFHSLQDPLFATQEFDLVKSQRIDGIKAIKDNAGYAVRLYFQRAYFGDNPLGRLSSGNETSLNAMSVEKVKDFYKARVTPRGAYAAVVGSLSSQELKALLSKTLGKWKGAGSPAAPLPPPPQPKGKTLILVDKPDATQAYWVLGAPGYSANDPVTPSAAVLNTLFGGRFTSWLSTELRIKRGLTYGASSRFQTFLSGGVFTASSYTKNDKIAEMLDLVFSLFEKAKSGFAPEEIESARNYIQGQFPPTLESNEAIAASLVQLMAQGKSFSWPDEYLRGVSSSTPETVQAAAKRLLPAQDYVLVVVGKAAEIEPLLAKYGEWKVKKITDSGF